jgi:hypothetical protein
MHKIFTRITSWLRSLAAVPCTDPLADLTALEIADLPPTHHADPCGC